MKTPRFLFAAVLFSSATMLLGEDSATLPRPIPLTRPEMKQLLEDVKDRHPRIPLPELSDDDRTRLGTRADNYEARLRYHYLPANRDQRGGPGGGFGRNSDPAMTLDYRFKTQLFWIVSRTNNCQYCLGHQESKLLGAGMKEDEIAALDGDWLAFSPGEQAAFRFARKFTFEPNRLADADIEALRAHYSDMQILEMILSLAGNNSINRWKEGAGIPQSRDGGGFDRRRSGNPPADDQRAAHTYLTPTAEGLRDRITTVAPLDFDITTGKATRLAVFARPPLEQPEQVQRALELARRRTPRLPLVEEAKARDALGKEGQDKPVPQWVRLLLNLPQDGPARIASFVAAQEQGDLSPKLKAQVAWIVARQDRAWYALGHAKRRLRELGQSEERIFELDRAAPDVSPADRSLLNVARKLAAAPIVLTDKDVAEAIRLAGPRDVTQLISYTTSLAAFNRITEAAGLQLED